MTTPSTGRYKTVDIQDISNNQELRLKAVERAGYMWLQNFRDRCDRYVHAVSFEVLAAVSLP